MYVSSNLSLNHMPLFGGSSPPVSSSQLTWGTNTLDLFKRPISSANVIDLTAETPMVKGADESWLRPGSAQPASGSGYYDWVNSMLAFRDAAEAGLGSVNGDGQNQAPAPANGASGSDNTTETQAADAGNGTSGDDANPDANPDAEAEAGTGSTENSGQRGGGLLGLLFGRR